MSIRALPSAAFLLVLFLPLTGIAQEIRYVDDDGDPGNGCTSWPDACRELQTALALAFPGDQIWVAQGTYTPSEQTDPKDPRTATIQLQSGVAIYGGFDGSEATLDERAGLFDLTILTGDLNGDDVPSEFPFGPSFFENSYHVVTGSGTDLTAVLDGFTITGGNANGPFFTGDRGAGIFCHSGSPTIGRCVIRDNRARLLGGGLHCRQNSDPRIHNCTIIGNFSHNRGGGIHAFFDSDLRIEECSILNNTAGLGGGGIHVEQESNMVMVDSIIANNQVIGESSAGGGVLVSTSSVQIHGCIIVGNSAERSGGGLLLGGSGRSALLSSSLIANNWSGDNGGGVYPISNSTTIANCTIVDNVAQNFGGGIFSAGSEVSIANTVLWGDHAVLGQEIYARSGGSPTGPSIVNLSYDNIDGGMDSVFVEGASTVEWGPGNLDLDPLFANPDNGDYRLLTGSPCIDAADNTAVPDDVTTDLNGNLRFVDDPATPDSGNPDGINPIVDIGAHEFNCVDDDGDGKVTICHNGHTISVSTNAVSAHLRHGDECGVCE